jgi:hypothetical protein
MTNDQDTLPKAPDHHSDAAIASIWLLLLTLIVTIEIGSLLLSRAISAGVLS